MPTSPFQNHFQVAYVTPDLACAIETFKQQFGVSEFLTLGTVTLTLEGGDHADINIALA